MVDVGHATLGQHWAIVTVRLIKHINTLVGNTLLGQRNIGFHESNRMLVWETLFGQCNRVFHKSYNMVVRETLFGQRWTNMLT